MFVRYKPTQTVEPRSTAALTWTTLQAWFCDKFDSLADIWEQEQEGLQQQFKDCPDRLCCDACLCTRPTWMTTLKCVVDRCGAEPPGWVISEKDEETGEWKTNRPDALLAQYHGKWLCERCYSPLSEVCAPLAVTIARTLATSQSVCTE